MFILISNTNANELIKANLLYIIGNFCSQKQNIRCWREKLLLPVTQTNFFGGKIFKQQEKKSAESKCLLFSPKSQKLPVIQ